VETRQLAAERKSKKTITLHGYSFYQETLVLKEQDRKELIARLGDARSFKSFGGKKFCDGFHPDYLLEWSVKRDVYRCLVCFGCCEVKLYGPKSGLRADFAEGEAFPAVKRTLSGYVKNRPAFKPDPLDGADE
jgi:hypothetical protein